MYQTDHTPEQNPILFQTYHKTKMQSRVADADNEMKICEVNNATASDQIEALETEINMLKNEIANSKSSISRNTNVFEPSQASNSLFGSYGNGFGGGGGGIMNPSLMNNLQSKLAAKEAEINGQLVERDAKILDLETRNRKMMQDMVGLVRYRVENGELQMQLRQLKAQVNNNFGVQGGQGSSFGQAGAAGGGSSSGKDMVIRQLQTENRRLQQSIIQQGITVTAKPDYDGGQRNSNIGQNIGQNMGQNIGQNMGQNMGQTNAQIQQLQVQLSRMKTDKDKMIQLKDNQLQKVLVERDESKVIVGQLRGNLSSLQLEMIQLQMSGGVQICPEIVECSHNHENSVPKTTSWSTKFPETTFPTTIEQVLSTIQDFTSEDAFELEKEFEAEIDVLEEVGIENERNVIPTSSASSTTTVLSKVNELELMDDMSGMMDNLQSVIAGMDFDQDGTSKTTVRSTEPTTVPTTELFTEPTPAPTTIQSTTKKITTVCSRS